MSPTLPSTPLFHSFTRPNSIQSQSIPISTVLNAQTSGKSSSNTILPFPTGIGESKPWSLGTENPFSAEVTKDGLSFHSLCEQRLILSVADRIAFAKSLDSIIDHNSNTALHLAVYKRDYELVYLLLLKGADPNLMNLSGFWPLDIAILLQHHDIISLLLCMGAQSASTSTPFYASYPPSSTSWAFFLPPSILPKLTNSSRKSSMSSDKYTFHSVDIPFLTLSSEIEPSIERLFFLSIAVGWKEKVMSLMKDMPHLIQFTDDQGTTCLIQAAKFGQLSVFSWLLTSADTSLVWKKDKYHLNALSWACLQGKVDIVSCLLQSPCSALLKSFLEDGNPTTTMTATCPLLLAAYEGEVQICELLVTQGMILPTPMHLMMACWMQRTKVVHYLLSLKTIVIPQPFTVWLKKGLVVRHWYLQGYTAMYPLTTSLFDAGLFSASPHLDPMLEIENGLAIASPESDIIGTEIIKSVPTKMAKQTALKEMVNKPLMLAIQPEYGSSHAIYLRDHHLQEEVIVDLSLPASFQSLIQFFHYQKIACFGTELDVQLNTIDDYFMQLLNAMGTQKKTKYSIIAFKISSLVETLCNHLKQSLHLYPLYLRSSINEMAQSVIEKELPPFIKKTQIASGVVPPPEALENLLFTIQSLRNHVRSSVGLSHVSGCWPLGRLFMTPHAEDIKDTLNTSSDSPPPLTASTKIGALRYDLYLKDSQLKQMDESRSADSSLKSPTSLSQFLAFPLSTFVQTTLSAHSLLLQCYLDRKSSDIFTLLMNQVTLLTQSIDQLMQSMEPKLSIISFTSIQRDEISNYKSKFTSAIQNLPRKTAQVMAIWPSPNIHQEVHQLLLDTAITVKHWVQYVEPLYLIKLKLSETEKKILSSQSAKLHALLKLWGESPSTPTQNQNKIEMKEIETYWFMQEKWNGLIFNAVNEVRGGQLMNLVERITHFQIEDPALLNVFLMTHHSFTTSTHLMGLLIQRYEIAPPPGLEDEKKFTVFVEYKMLPIKQRVLDVIVFWMSHFFADFLSEEKALIVQLKNFLSTTVIKELPKRVEEISQLLNTQMKQIEGVSSLNTSKESRPVFPKLIFSKSISKLNENIHCFVDIDPLELARQLTLLESECFQKLSNKEWINQIWGRTHEASKTKAPNIQKMINITNGLSKKLVYLILSTEKLQKRLSLIKHCVMFAQHCYELKNLNGLTGIMGGLGMGPVRRLTNMWNEFKKKFPKLDALNEKLSDLVSPKRQYANYRQFMKSATSPCIPYLGIFNLENLLPNFSY
ncbi:hypothetical protein HMI55_006995 [Coelomomyces lativittatus]|nr:hypothetical protein HMI55_006995 [Coelomomyces lativittatus]